MVFHNFIRDSATKDDDFDEYEGMEEQELNPPNPEDVPEVEVTRYEPIGDAYMTGVRNSIEESIWQLDNYFSYCFRMTFIVVGKMFR